MAVVPPTSSVELALSNGLDGCCSCARRWHRAAFHEPGAIANDGIHAVCRLRAQARVNARGMTKREFFNAVSPPRLPLSPRTSWHHNRQWRAKVAKKDLLDRIAWRICLTT